MAAETLKSRKTVQKQARHIKSQIGVAQTLNKLIHSFSNKLYVVIFSNFQRKILCFLLSLFPCWHSFLFSAGATSWSHSPTASHTHKVCLHIFVFPFSTISDTQINLHTIRVCVCVPTVPWSAPFRPASACQIKSPPQCVVHLLRWRIMWCIQWAHDDGLLNYTNNDKWHFCYRSLSHCRQREKGVNKEQSRLQRRAKGRRQRGKKASLWKKRKSWRRIRDFQLTPKIILFTSSATSPSCILLCFLTLFLLTVNCHEETGSRCHLCSFQLNLRKKIPSKIRVCWS